jgi:teichuronic acid biosynthesis glycosyltransferase TuaG
MSHVSIIMPTYNAGRFISESIESVIEQTYENWELLICDDGSIDNSVNIARRYSYLDERIKTLSNSYNKGASGARNTCLDAATGRYIAFLDADDLWFPNKLKLQIIFMKLNNYSFVFSYHEIMSEHGLFIHECKAPSSVNAMKMRTSNFISCLTVVYDSNVIGKVFQPEIRRRNDFALWLKILNGGKIKRAYCLPVTTARYRTNSYGLSSNKTEALKYFKRCLLEFGGCNAFEGYVYSIIYLFIILLKKKFIMIYNLVVVKC